MPNKTSDNPLLFAPNELPRFDIITPEHVRPAITTLLDELEAGLAQLERDVDASWSGLIEPLEQLIEPLQNAWVAVGHLLSVRNCDALRSAHESMQPRVIEVLTRTGQSKPLYEAAKSLREGPGWQSLEPGQQRIIDKLILEAELSGVGLDGAARERFAAVQTELGELSTKFNNNVLDATKAFALVLHERDEVAGLPESLLRLAAQTEADASGTAATPTDGPWRITLDQPSFGPFLQHSTRRDLREKVYRAFLTRASDGDVDNSPLIDRILELRREEARLLEFDNYAAMSLASKMADSLGAVRDLLERLLEKAYPGAQRDMTELRAFAAERGANYELQHWDIAYWSEQLREQRFSFTDEDLRPYFPLPHVLDGMFALAGRLFGVDIVAADGDAPVWHEDVRFFRIQDQDGTPRAAFFLDPYSRPAEKRGGAWMRGCVGRSQLFKNPDGSPRLPVAYLVCNGTPPLDDRPSLMTFREVETLFHEFGHGLQHMLTTVDFDRAAGINGVEWDAVELPSQFMENWCYHRPTLERFSAHWETGEPLPDELFQKIVAARTFRAGSDTLRQLYFAMTDIALHDDYEPARDGSPFDVQRKIAERTTVLTPLPEDRFLCAFSHIFAGGYAAGYYSYKWAEVLSADAFSAFEEAGLDDADAIRTTGRRFRDTVLSLGGSRHPMHVFKKFRGREPSTDALLRHSGLAS